MADFEESLTNSVGEELSKEVESTDESEEDKSEDEAIPAKKVRSVGRPRKYPPKVGQKPKDQLPKKRGRPLGSKKKVHESLSSSMKLNLRKRSRSGTVMNSKLRAVPEFQRAQEDEKCDICRSGNFQNMLYCTDCCYRAHLNCLKLDQRQPLKEWKCMYCNDCPLCDKPKYETMVVCCDQCSTCFHVECVQTNILESEPTEKWCCCNKEKIPAYSKRDNKVVTTRYGYPKSNLTKGELNRIMWYYPKRIPDPKDWTLDDVRSFIDRLGFQKEGQDFWEESVDGKALLLLRRKDVISSLQSILGHALKIYLHVACLQQGFCMPQLG